MELFSSTGLYSAAIPLTDENLSKLKQGCLIICETKGPGLIPFYKDPKTWDLGKGLVPYQKNIVMFLDAQFLQRASRKRYIQVVFGELVGWILMQHCDWFVINEKSIEL